MGYQQTFNKAFSGASNIAQKYTGLSNALYDSTIWAINNIFFPNTEVRTTSDIPYDKPLIIMLNHTIIPDPFVAGGAFKKVVPKGYHVVSPVMRDNFFEKNVPMKIAGLTVGLYTALVNNHLISRGRPTAGQIKDLSDILDRNGNFLLFPTATRTKSGRIYDGESPDLNNIGFMTHLLQKNVGQDVYVLPGAITYAPVQGKKKLTGKRTVCFGEAIPFSQYVPDINAPGKIARGQRNEFSTHIQAEMGKLFNPGVAHLASYYMVNHVQSSGDLVKFSDSGLEKSVGRIRDKIVDENRVYFTDRLLESGRLFGRVREFLDWAYEQDIITFDKRNGNVTVDKEQLTDPHSKEKLRKTRPLVFLANQISHLGLEDVVS